MISHFSLLPSSGFFDFVVLFCLPGHVLSRRPGSAQLLGGGMVAGRGTVKTRSFYPLFTSVMQLNENVMRLEFLSRSN